jgi:alkylhydroperoxidase family enzyme
MKMCGYNDQQIAEVVDWRQSAFFDDKQRAMLGYVEQMANGGNVDDPTFAELSRFFTPQQIIEISYTVGTYYSTGLARGEIDKAEFEEKRRIIAEA